MTWDQYISASVEEELKNIRCKSMGRNDQCTFKEWLLYTSKIGEAGERNYKTEEKLGVITHHKSK